MRDRASPNAEASELGLGASVLIATVFAFALPTAYGEELIARGAEWRYLDDGSDQGTAWRGKDFDDSGWESGPAQLGFGEGRRGEVGTNMISHDTLTRVSRNDLLLPARLQRRQCRER